MSAARPPVVLLHGLGRTARSMGSLRRHLERRGYATWARSYPSRRMPIAELAHLVADWVAADLGAARPYAVTHSLGGILVRHMAVRVDFRSTVMLAPPNRGSQLATRLLSRPAFAKALGPAARDIVQGGPWPAPPTPFAVIAGTRAPSIGNPASWLSRPMGVFGAGEPNDGTLSVAETRIEGMAEHAQIDASHTWIMRDPRVHKMVVAWLETGRMR